MTVTRLQTIQTLHTCSVSSEQLELRLSTIQTLHACSVNSEQLDLELTLSTIIHYTHVVWVQNS